MICYPLIFSTASDESCAAGGSFNVATGRSGGSGNGNKSKRRKTTYETTPRLQTHHHESGADRPVPVEATTRRFLLHARDVEVRHAAPVDDAHFRDAPIVHSD